MKLFKTLFISELQFLDTQMITSSSAKVVGLGAIEGLVEDLLEGKCVSFCQVNHMYVVPHPGTVWGLVVVTKHIEVLPPSHSNLKETFQSKGAHERYRQL